MGTLKLRCAGSTVRKTKKPKRQKDKKTKKSFFLQRNKLSTFWYRIEIMQYFQFWIYFIMNYSFRILYVEAVNDLAVVHALTSHIGFRYLPFVIWSCENFFWMLGELTSTWRLVFNTPFLINWTCDTLRHVFSENCLLWVSKHFLFWESIFFLAKLVLITLTLFIYID